MSQTFSDIFEELFRDSGLSSEMIERCANDFSGIAFLHILGATQKKLTVSEREHLGKLLESKDYSDVTKFLVSKYSDDEWKALLEKEIKPLLEDYIEKVGL